MKKLQLHWQILIALIIAIVYGILFPTSYKLDDKAFKNIAKTSVPKVLVNKLKEHNKNVVYEEKQAFNKAIEKTLGADLAESYSKILVKKAYYNKPVEYIAQSHPD